MFNINMAEALVIGLVVLLVVGPERLPSYAAQLGQAVRNGRRMAFGLREQVRDELGPEFDDVDWRKLDPRQYDPRRIVREALADTVEDERPGQRRTGSTRASATRSSAARSSAARSSAARSASSSGHQGPKPRSAGGPTPFDPDAT